MPRSFSLSQLSLRYSIYLLIGIILLVTLLLMIGGLFYFLLDAENRFWESRLQDAAEQAADLLGTHLEDSLYALKTITNLHESLLADAGIPSGVRHGPSDHASLQVAMRALLEQDPTLLELVISHQDRAVETHLASPSAADAPVLADPEAAWNPQWDHFRLDENVYLSSLITPADPEEAPYVIMSIRREGTLAAARIDMFRLTEVIADIAIGDTGDAYVADLIDGRVILH
jgi:hypothetical protein